jgi:hypothetical protein
LSGAARRAHVRSALSAVGFWLATTGAILLLVPGLIAVGLFIIFISAIALGIGMGTQKKDFYV